MLEDASRQLYIVDDDQAVARTVARCARGIGFSTQYFESADQMMAELAYLPHGCVVLDVKMPGTDGVQLLKILGEQRPDLPVVMLSAYAEVGSVVESFRSGALHFLSKPFSQAELRSTLMEAARIGDHRLSQALNADELDALNSLTKREHEVLALIAEGQQSKTIAWKLAISMRTVDQHRSNIISKLKVRNSAQAASLLKAFLSSQKQ